MMHKVIRNSFRCFSCSFQLTLLHSILNIFNFPLPDKMTPSPDFSLQYPIGKFQAPAQITETVRNQWIEDIALAPQRLKDAIHGLSATQLDTAYRPGGWTVRQVIHHLPDSHMNAYIRIKMALTEEVPTVKPYEEHLWAELYDTYHSPVDVSVTLLESLHQRWVILLGSLSESSWQRSYRHPQSGIVVLYQVAGLYAWHGNHHIAHITSLRERMAW
jgi:hypothetical protein